MKKDNWLPATIGFIMNNSLISNYRTHRLASIPQGYTVYHRSFAQQKDVVRVEASIWLFGIFQSFIG
jgi:hypothetical protein